MTRANSSANAAVLALRERVEATPAEVATTSASSMGTVSPPAPTPGQPLHLDPGPLVVVLVLAAAVLHATWNAIAHAAEDQLVGFALISTSTLVLGTVMVLVGEPVGWHYFWLAALSAGLHVAYLLLLMASYQVADLSRAYPLSRGTGVALVAVASIVLPRSPLGLDVVLGTGLVVVGLVGVTLAGSAADPRGRPRHRDRARHGRGDRRATRSWTGSPCRAARPSSRTPAG